MLSMNMIWRLALAIVLGYAVLFFGMWLFSRGTKKKKEEAKP